MNSVKSACVALAYLASPWVGNAAAADQRSIYVCADDAATIGRVRDRLPGLEVVEGNTDVVRDSWTGVTLAFFGRLGGPAEACAANFPGFAEILGGVVGAAGNDLTDERLRAAGERVARPSEYTQIVQWDVANAGTTRWFMDLCFLPPAQQCPAGDSPDYLRELMLGP
jgi:hypothetical protein